ncbi:hypothetical protein [Paenibacillus sp. NPDC057967]|uniref:hypothetical protein n=1 Tax=Paenibacillus sp. NPDC057967 TaxID=3346293 RepID=UPI0036D7F6C4
MKKIYLSLLLVFTLTLNASTVIASTGTKITLNHDLQITLIDSENDDLLVSLKELSSVDESFSKISDYLHRIDVNDDKKFKINNSNDGIFIYNISEFRENINRVFPMIESGANLYFYGEDSLIKLVLQHYDDEQTVTKNLKEIDTSLAENNPQYNLISFKDKKLVLNASINVFDLEGTILETPASSFVHSILLNIKSSNESTVSPLNYGSDTIVWNPGDIVDSTYVVNASNQPILRGKLLSQMILFQNTRSDTDPNYDYFYLRNNVETTSYNSGLMKNAEANHILPFPADQLLSWGPSATTTSSLITVGLPWNVSWAFTVSPDTMKITNSGDSATKNIHWKLFKPGIFPFHNTEYTMPSPSRIQPGIAWSSAGSSLAGINVINKAKLEFGTSTYTMQNSRNIRYNY